MSSAPCEIILREDLDRNIKASDINDNFRCIKERFAAQEILVESVNGQFEELVVTGAEWREPLWLVETDFTIDTGFYKYQLDNTKSTVIILSTYNSTDRVYLPLIADSYVAGKSMVVTVVAKDSFVLYPHPTDSGDGGLIVTTAGVSNLLISTGNQRKLVTNGTNWYTIGF